MNAFKALQLATQITGIISSDHPKLKNRKGDQALYAAARLLAERLEDRNPGIAQATGWVDDVQSAS